MCKCWTAAHFPLLLTIFKALILDSIKRHIDLNINQGYYQDHTYIECPAHIEFLTHLYCLVDDLHHLLLLACEVDKFIAALDGESAHASNTKLLKFMLDFLENHGSTLLFEFTNSIRMLKIWHDGVTNNIAVLEGTLAQSIRRHLGWALHHNVQNLKYAISNSALMKPSDFAA